MKPIRRVLVGALALAAGIATSARVEAAPIYADVIAVVDESGSMAGEHAWLGTMVTSLEAGLQTAGVTGPNQYGLVGYGGGGGAHPVTGHQHAVGGGQFGTAAQFAAATGGLVTTGGTEDGWAGINFALGYAMRADSARNMILVTDEDRDNTNAALTFAGVTSALNAANVLLNAVVDASFRCGAFGANQVLGVDSTGRAYVADGLGGYTTCEGAVFASAAGTTKADYVDMAWATGGAAWNLNLLRAGGLTATSFSNAFVAVKVEEISQQPTPSPEPATMLLMGVGLAAAVRRRMRG
jgi:hypothetical protein